MGKVDPKVDEAIETLNMKDGPTRRRLLTGTGLFSATAAASALLTACSSSSSKAGGTSSGSSAIGDFPKTPAWQFWFVNHVTTNLFFVPTKLGYADAASLLGLPTPKWGGSETASVPQMTSYISAAISGKAAGIATVVVTADSFTTPVANAMNAGIPVISYNADGIYKSDGTPVIGTNRLCYVGQALYLSGQQLGERIVSLVDSGDVVIFIATPGAGQHPAQVRRRGRRDQGLRQADQGPPVGHRCHDRAGTGRREGVLHRQQGHQGRVRRGRGLDRTARPGDGGHRPARIPAGGFDLTPGTLDRDPERSRWTSPSTRSRTCRASCRRCTCTCTTCRAAWSVRRTPTPA